MSKFVYDLVCSHSGWRLHWNIMGVEHVVGEFLGLSGCFVFDSEDASACRLHLRTTLGQKRSLLQFTSWRFRKVGQREYWIAGPLSLGNVTEIAALRLYGPSTEEVDRQAEATVIAKAPASWLHPVVSDVEALQKAREVIFDFNLKLTLRSLVESKRAAA